MSSPKNTTPQINPKKSNILQRKQRASGNLHQSISPLQLPMNQKLGEEDYKRLRQPQTIDPFLQFNKNTTGYPQGAHFSYMRPSSSQQKQYYLVMCIPCPPPDTQFIEELQRYKAKGYFSPQINPNKMLKMNDPISQHGLKGKQFENKLPQDILGNISYFNGANRSEIQEAIQNQKPKRQPQRKIKSQNKLIVQKNEQPQKLNKETESECKEEAEDEFEVEDDDDDSDFEYTSMASRLRRKTNSSLQSNDKLTPTNQGKEQLNLENIVVTRKKSKTIEQQQKLKISHQTNENKQGNVEKIITEISEHQEKPQKLSEKTAIKDFDVSIVSNIHSKVRGNDNKFGQEIINDSLIPKLQQLTIKEQNQTPKNNLMQIEEDVSIQSTKSQSSQSTAGQIGQTKVETGKGSNLLLENQQQLVKYQVQPFENKVEQKPQEKSAPQNILNYITEKSKQIKKKNTLQANTSITKKTEVNESRNEHKSQEQSIFLSPIQNLQNQGSHINEFQLETNNTDKQTKKITKTQSKQLRKLSQQMQTNSVDSNHEIRQNNAHSTTEQTKVHNNPKQKIQNTPFTPTPKSAHDNLNSETNIQNINQQRQCQSENISVSKNIYGGADTYQGYEYGTFNSSYQMNSNQSVQQNQIKIQNFQSFPQNNLGQYSRIQNNEQLNLHPNPQYLHHLHNNQINFQQPQCFQQESRIPYPIYYQQGHQTDGFNHTQNQPYNKTLFTEDERIDHQQYWSGTNGNSTDNNQLPAYYPSFLHKYNQHHNQQNDVNDERIFEILGEIKDELEEQTYNQNQ